MRIEIGTTVRCAGTAYLGGFVAASAASATAASRPMALDYIAVEDEIRPPNALLSIIVSASHVGGRQRLIRLHAGLCSFPLGNDLLQRGLDRSEFVEFIERSVINE